MEKSNDSKVEIDGDNDVTDTIMRVTNKAASTAADDSDIVHEMSQNVIETAFDPLATESKARKKEQDHRRIKEKYVARFPGCQYHMLFTVWGGGEAVHKHHSSNQ